MKVLGSHGSWWFFANPFEKYAKVKLDHVSPSSRGEHTKSLKSCHHLVKYKRPIFKHVVFVDFPPILRFCKKNSIPISGSNLWQGDGKRCIGLRAKNTVEKGEPRFICQEVFGPPKGLVRRCLWVQTSTHNVFGRLGYILTGWLIVILIIFMIYDDL